MRRLTPIIPITRGPARATLLAAALAVAGLTGCTSLAPTYQRPAAPVPALLPVPAQAAASAALTLPEQAQVPLAWADFVRDERLRGLVRQALAANRDLRVAALGVQRAQAQLGLADADRWPTVNAAFNTSRAPNTQGVQTTGFQLGLQVSAWELDFFGRLRSLSDAAQAQWLSSEAGRRSSELALVAAVISADRSLAADLAVLALAERTRASRADSLRLTQLRFDGGAASQLERQTAASLAAQADAALAQARRQVALDRNALALLLGGTVPAEAVPGSASASGAVAVAEPLAPVPTGLDSAVLLRRPDVLQAEQALIAANANIGAARAAYFPRISLTGSAGLVSGDLGNLLGGGTFAWSIASQAVAAIFDHGRNRANVEVSTLNRDIAVAQYEKAVQSAFRDSADALAGLATWRSQLDAQQQQLAAVREIARLTDLRYRNGAASELERLDAERSLFAAEQAVIQVQLAEQLNRVALWKALGG
ncbi:efflux transporter outer membrane subunit [Sphaerotilus microaerophilus]|uniref:AdeC/adeK/oprM family multidrug efflux complex outer membrane factor n=1 Tax=Sphaerotilus microaerophilus TaxID=2914710 RepID=A0ABN6PHX4_9BURK|nr:efflux transporter outer membrane subunit [Sphaerotilus sp. FB-5]BDI03887.1 adeC/adeK/oprM family multidrug efflux complex outer membrane factor [Sphaerotilus sp. FB-5]